jgi:hypothetical protein
MIMTNEENAILGSTAYPDTHGDTPKNYRSTGQGTQNRHGPACPGHLSRHVLG